jgi:hypothetical protein
MARDVYRCPPDLREPHKESIMRKFLFLSLVAASLLLTVDASRSSDRHVNTTLNAVGGSGVSGKVMLTSLPKGGTLINVVATGLKPGTEYLSLYYDNGTCDLEPYSADDVIGHYTADAHGEGHAQAKVDDDLDEIHSVSVRLNSDFTLQACAAVAP